VDETGARGVAFRTPMRWLVAAEHEPPGMVGLRNGVPSGYPPSRCGNMFK